MQYFFEMQSQPKIDSYFPVQFSEGRKFKSRRVKRVVNRLLDKESDDDEKITVKKRKVMKSTKNSKNATNSVNEEQTNDVGIRCDSRAIPNDSSPSSKTSFPRSLKNANASAVESNSDSTSDTSDDDRSFAPFKTSRGQPVARGSASRSRGSRRIGNKSRTRKKS